MLRHLPIECDVLLVEIDLTTLVSPEILLPFQVELDKRAGKRRERAKRAQKEKKRDLDHMLAQTLHIEEIKALARTESERKLGMIRELINGPALSMHAGGDAVGDSVGDGTGDSSSGGGGGREEGEKGGGDEEANNNNPDSLSQEHLVAEGPGLGPALGLGQGLGQGLGLGLGQGLSVEGDSSKVPGAGAPRVLSFAKITQVS